LQAPSFEEIAEASQRIREHLERTPLLESERLNGRAGARILVKAESLQVTGSFKARGAWNWMASRDGAERGRGVVALSSGNHAQAVAWAANKMGVAPVVVLMPQDAPEIKRARTKDLGAEVLLYDRETADRAILVKQLETDRNLSHIPAYDDRRIVAGAATVATELFEDARALGASIDELIVPCAGGGLLAGCALALEHLSPHTRIWGVEPEAFDDTARSLISGTRERVAAGASSICDALVAPTPGELTFSINRERVSGIFKVSDCEARSGMRVAMDDLGLVTEPSGALAIRAALANSPMMYGRTVAVVVSGRNIDADTYASMVRWKN
jgi:threonine dehydratase